MFKLNYKSDDAMLLYVKGFKIIPLTPKIATPKNYLNKSNKTFLLFWAVFSKDI